MNTIEVLSLSILVLFLIRVVARMKKKRELEAIEKFM